MNGGYIMIYKNSKKIYLELFACLNLGKPILWYEDKNTCFFIDTISGGEISTEIVDDEEVRTYGDIILTKGGMTITITAENVVSEVGDIQPSGGSSVVANPTLSGDEGDLTGLEVNGVKYAIPSGGEVATIYEHYININLGGYIGLTGQLKLTIINNSNSDITWNSLGTFLRNNIFSGFYKLGVTGSIKITEGDNTINGICHAIWRASGEAIHIDYFDLNTLQDVSYDTTGKNFGVYDRKILIQQ